MSTNIAVIYSGELAAVAEAFGEAANHLAADVRLLPLPDSGASSTGGDHRQPDLHILEWADGVAFGTPIGPGEPAQTLMAFINDTEPLWTSGRLYDKVVTVFTDEPQRLAPDSVLHPIYDSLYRWGAVIVGPRALELEFDARLEDGPLDDLRALPVSVLRATQYRAVRLARLARVLADERHSRERLRL